MVLAWRVLKLFNIFSVRWGGGGGSKGPSVWIRLKGQCPDYAHARAPPVFSSKDNRTVILTRQHFLPDRTAHGDLLFIFSSRLLKNSFVLYKHLARGSKTDRDFIASWAALRPENLVPLALKTYFLIWNSCQRSIAPSPVISAWFARVLASNVWKT